MRRLFAVVLSILLLVSLTGCVDQAGYPLDINGSEPGQPLRIYVEGGIGLGTGNVTANANLTDHSIIRGDGGALGVQDSGVTISDADDLDTNGGDLTGFDVNATNDLNAGNNLDVTDDADIGGILDVVGQSLFGANMTVTGNVSATAFFGDGSHLTGIAGTGNVTAIANLTSDRVTVGDDGVLGIKTTGVIIDASDNITTTGNVTADYFFGDGSNLTNLPGGGNVTASSNLTSNNITIGDDGTLGIKSSGVVIDASDNITTTGNVTADSFFGTLDTSEAKGTWTASGTWTLPAMTFGGGVTISENVSLLLDASISAEYTWCGIAETGTAGTTLAFGDLVYYAAADSRWELADADTETATKSKLGICIQAAANDGSATVILLYGKVRADTAFPALTIGAPVFVSTTDGDIDSTPPSGAGDFIRIIGYGNTADELFFCPEATWIEHA